MGTRKKQEIGLWQFAWDLNLSGYELIEALVPRRTYAKILPKDSATQEERKPPFVREKFLADRRDSDGRFYRYPVLCDETGLFRTFADTDWHSDDKIKEFANLYGRLGIEELIAHEVMWGERLSSWRNEIETMRKVILLSDWIEEGNMLNLGKVIVWASDGKSVYYTESGGPSKVAHDHSIDPVFSSGVCCTIASDRVHPERIGKMKPGDPVIPAWNYIQQTINARLQQHNVCPRLLWEGPRLSFFIAPVSLIGALWLQFADAIARRPRFGRCDQCRKWFEFTRGKRSDSRFCEIPCKNRWHRENSKGSGK
jgi:hypothetical protein